MKKVSMIAILFSFVSLPLFAAPLQSLGSGEGELNVVAWAGYLERGETVEAFEAYMNKHNSSLIEKNIL